MRRKSETTNLIIIRIKRNEYTASLAKRYFFSTSTYLKTSVTSIRCFLFMYLKHTKEECKRAVIRRKIKSGSKMGGSGGLSSGSKQVTFGNMSCQIDLKHYFCILWIISASNMITKLYYFN